MSATSSLGEEMIPANEPNDIRELLGILQAIQEKKDRQKHPVPRTVHNKQHGCVRAELVVETGLPQELRHGVFREPRTHEAVVRFSNSKQSDDRIPDAHGMAIKLFNIEGEKLLENERSANTQDFVLVDHPVFFVKNVADFIPLAHDFHRLMTGGPVGKARTIFKAMVSPGYRFRLLRKAGAKRPENLLAIRYWSMTPFKLGEGAIKISLRPQLGSEPAPSAGTADKLRLAMAAQLRVRDACFDFLVQLRTDTSTMPIEDPTVKWDESVAPFRKVGTLRIPRQNFDSPGQMAF